MKLFLINIVMEIIVACKKEKKEGDRERKKEIHTRNIMKRKEEKRKLLDIDLGEWCGTRYNVCV